MLTVTAVIVFKYCIECRRNSIFFFKLKTLKSKWWGGGRKGTKLEGLMSRSQQSSGKNFGWAVKMAMETP